MKYIDDGVSQREIAATFSISEASVSKIKERNGKAKAPKMSEKAIEKQIIIWLRSKGYFCTKIDNTGIYDQKLGKFRRQIGTYKLAGVSDIYMLYRGVSIWLEVKSLTGKLSQPQKEFQASVQRHGGCAFTVRSVTDVESALTGLSFSQPQRASELPSQLGS